MRYVIVGLLTLFLAFLVFCSFGCVSHRFGAFTGKAAILGIGTVDGHGVIASSDALKTSKDQLQDVRLKVKYVEGRITDVKWETFSTEGSPTEEEEVVVQ